MELFFAIQELGLHEASRIMIGFSVADSLENNLWFHLSHDSQREESFCIGGEPSIPGFLKNLYGTGITFIRVQPTCMHGLSFMPLFMVFVCLFSIALCML